MRGITLSLLVLLAACSPRGTTGLGTGAPGLDVADAAMKSGSPEIALQIVGGILAKDPDNEAALLTQGEALTELRRPDDAGVSFTRALAQNPTSVGAEIGLGRLRLATDPAGAEALFLEALQHEPRNGVALNDLGIARDLQGNHVAAQAAYRQALGVSPDMAAAQVNLALSLAMTGQAKDAVQLLRPLATGPGTSQQVRHDLAAVLTMGGDKTEAEHILSQDLPPNEVQKAMAAYASGETATTASLLTPGVVTGDNPAAAPTAPAKTAVPTAPAKTAVPTASAETAVPIAPAEAAVPTAPAKTAMPTPTAPAETAAAAPVPPAPAATAEPTRAVAAGTATASTVEVQLAAAPSESAAHAEWQRLQKQMPQLLSDRQPIVAKVERDGRVFWRLRTGGFADASAAAAFCDHVRQAGTACLAEQR
jgi:Flp pilus assembly protein TadD